MASPVTKPLSGPASHRATPAMSAGSPPSGHGWNDGIRSRSAASSRPMASGVKIRPGQMALTRMWCGASSTALLNVRLTTADLAAE